jgi:hypothetical protein
LASWWRKKGAFSKKPVSTSTSIGGYGGNRTAKELDHGLFIRARRLDQHAAELQERREGSVYRRNQYALTCGDLLHQRGAPAGDSRFSKIM